MSSSKPSRRGSAESQNVTTAISSAHHNHSPFADTAEPNSYSDISVRSDCDEVNNFQNSSTLASVDTSKNTYRVTELEKKRIEGPLFDTKHSDFAQFFEEPLQCDLPYVHGSSLLWHTTSDVCEVVIHGRQPQYAKHSERVVPNQWRRFGTLSKLSTIGGWSNKRKKNTCTEIKPGSQKPIPPNQPEFALHREPTRPISFKLPPNNVPSDVCARNLAFQVAIRVEKSWFHKSWFNAKRLHFIDGKAQQHSSRRPTNASISAAAPTTTITDNAKSMLQLQARSRIASQNSTDECPTAVSGQFSDSSISSTSTASINGNRKGGGAKKEKQ